MLTPSLDDRSPRPAPTDDRERLYSFLIARPAEATATEIQQLVEIAQEANIGNTRPENVHRHVNISGLTLGKRLPWEAGLMCLVTESHPAEGGVAHLVGSAKLQYMVDACWRREVRTRAVNKEYDCEIPWLIYDSAPSHAAELAGNVVLPAYRSMGVGKFHVQARLLFVLTHGIAPFTRLLANLLTDEVDGAYPFYELVVKPFLGRTDTLAPGGNNHSRATAYAPEHRFYSYDEADYLRYHDLHTLNQLLGPLSTYPPIQFPIHVLPKAIQQKFGAVRPITQRVQHVLERYGFKATDKFDLLDGGQYFDISLAALRRTCTRYLRDQCVQPSRELLQDAPYVTFTPSQRPQEQFMCARARAELDGDTLWIPETVFERLRLSRGDDVRVLLDPPHAGR